MAKPRSTDEVTERATRTGERSTAIATKSERGMKTGTAASYKGSRSPNAAKERGTTDNSEKMSPKENAPPQNPARKTTTPEKSKYGNQKQRMVAANTPKAVADTSQKVVAKKKIQPSIARNTSVKPAPVQQRQVSKYASGAKKRKE